MASPFQSETSPPSRQRLIVERYLLVEDVQERLAAIAELAKKLPPVHASQKTEEYLVRGCVSRVWLINAPEDGRCHFRADADSTIVKGLVSLVCQVYEGCAPADVAAFETTVLSELQLDAGLTPTRRNGIQNVIRRIRDLAAEMA